MVVAAVCVFSFTTCKKDSGYAYSPSKKIARIYKQYSGQPKFLSETWTWNGNQLARIDYENGFFVTFNYENKQLVSITGSSDYYLHFFYTGFDISIIEEYYYNELVYQYEFMKSNPNGVSKIDRVAIIEFYQGIHPMAKSSKETPPMGLRFILPEQIIETIATHRSQQKTRKDFLPIYTTYLDLTWQGENISEMYVSEYDEYGNNIPYSNIIYTYTYDNKTNPFYGAFGTNGYPIVLQKHNMITINGFIVNSYVYNGNFPITVTDADGTTFYEYK
jgi:hypothetical protein